MQYTNIYRWYKDILQQQAINILTSEVIWVNIIVNGLPVYMSQDHKNSI